MIARAQSLPRTPPARPSLRDGGWRLALERRLIFVSSVIAERLERDRALHAALPVTGRAWPTCWAAADFLHHSVPSRAELEDSVRRLAGAGLLTVDDDLVEVAPAGEHLWRNRPFSGLSSRRGHSADPAQSSQRAGRVGLEAGREDVRGGRPGVFAAPGRRPLSLT